jgi:putative oxidoreductase
MIEQESVRLPSSGTIGLYGRAVGMLNRISWDILAIPMRLAAFSVFWRSGNVKLDDWAGTLDLFRNDYKLPLLPPEFAAYMATTMELGCSTLILLGLATRFAALGLLGMILTIQTLVYPNAWPDHIQWIAFIIPLLVRGAGRYSIDQVIARVIGRR